MALKHYKDRDMYYYAFTPKGRYYQLMAEDYSRYYENQLAIASKRLRLLNKLGVVYDGVKNMYLLPDGQWLDA